MVGWWGGDRGAETIEGEGWGTDLWGAEAVVGGGRGPDLWGLRQGGGALTCGGGDGGVGGH